MTRNNRNIWMKLCRLRRLRQEIDVQMQQVFEMFTEEELEINLHASNSSNLYETLNCFVQYDEDGEKIEMYLQERGGNEKTG